MEEFRRIWESLQGSERISKDLKTTEKSEKILRIPDDEFGKILKTIERIKNKRKASRSIWNKPKESEKHERES